VGRQALHEGGDLVLEVVDLGSEARQRSTRLRASRATVPGTPSSRALDRVVGAGSVEAAGGGLPGRVELVEMPAKPSGDAGAFCDKDFAVVDQQLQLAVGAVQASDRKIRFAQRGPGDREGVDRIRLAVYARRLAHVGHQLRRHPRDLLAGCEQVSFQPPGQMPAVLDRPPTATTVFGAELRRPLQHPQVISCAGADGSLTELAAVVVDRDDRVGPPRYRRRPVRSAADRAHNALS
jgi:hypothetical protein